MSDNDHWHYSGDIHGGAEEHHRHYDLEQDTTWVGSDLMSYIRGLREDIGALTERVRELESSQSLSTFTAARDE